MIKPCVRQAAFRKNISWLLILCFSFNTLLLNTLPANCAHASAVPAYTGVPSPALPSQNLPLLQGIRLSSEHPFELEFMIGSDLQPAPAPAETDKIIKYFLTFITIPDEDLWVNLSPAEPDRIIPPALGRTLAGQALLTFDYQLKQLAASITNPDTGPGRLFWSKVYAEASRLYGTTDIPLSAYNKVWFTPKRAIIYEKDNAALVSECSLQVMLESDYLAKTGTGQPDSRPGDPEISTRIYRDVIVPLLTRELNGSAEFRSLRQLLHSLVLAQWFKHRLHRNIITRLYGNHRKLDGLDEVQRQAITNIYDRYLESYRRGSYNFIREDLDRARNNLVPHKYFSGGFHAGRFTDWAQLRPVSYSPGLTGILDKLSKKIFRVTVTLSPVLTGEPSPARTPTTQATELPPAKNTVRPTVRTTTRALPLGVTGALLAPSVLQAGERSPVLLAALEGGSSALASIQDTLSNPYLSIAVPTTALFLWLLRNIFRNRSHVINNIDQLSQEKRFLQAVNLFLKAAPASPFQHQLAQPLVPGNPYTLQDIRTQRIGDKVDITLLASTGMVDLAPEKKTQIGQAFADAFAAGDIVARSGGDSLELEHVDISSRRISLILTGRLRSPPETLSSVEIACRDNSGGYSNIFQRPLANNQLAELSVLWESLLTMPSWDNDTVAGLILRIQEYRRNNPPEFTQFSEQANAFYRIRALALTSYRKLADTEDAPAQRAYFQQLFHYSNRIRFVMSHCGTLDSYKSHFLEQQDRIFMFRTPASLAEAMRKVFLVKLSFQKSIVAIRSCIPALIREDSLLNKLEQNITGQNAPTRTSAELEAKLDKFTRNLEFPANNSIEGPDLTRRHGQIYSFLKYLLGLPGIILLGTGMGQPLQAGIALLSSLTHLFYHRYLTSLMTPHLILRESETHNQLVPDLPADSYGGQTAAQQGTAQPEPQTQAPEEFSALITSWQQLLQTGTTPATDDLDEIAGRLAAFRRQEPPTFDNFRTHLSRYFQIRDLARQTVDRLNGNVTLRPHKELFALWALYANEVRFGMTRFADLDVLKSKFLPPFHIKFLNMTIGEPALKLIRAFFGLSFRYTWAKVDALNCSRTIAALHRQIAEAELELRPDTQQVPDDNDLESALLNSLQHNDLKYRYPMAQGLVGRYLYQRVFDTWTMAINLAALVFLGGSHLFHPGLASIEFFGISLAGTSLFLYLMSSWIRPLQAYMESLREYSSFKRLIKATFADPRQTHKHGEKLHRAMAASENILYGSSYITAFFYPFILPAILLFQLATLPRDSHETLLQAPLPARPETVATKIQEAPLSPETKWRQACRLFRPDLPNNPESWMVRNEDTFPSEPIFRVLAAPPVWIACPTDSNDNTAQDCRNRLTQHVRRQSHDYAEMSLFLSLYLPTPKSTQEKREIPALSLPTSVGPSPAEASSPRRLRHLSEHAKDSFEGFRFSILQTEAVTSAENYLDYFFSMKGVSYPVGVRQ